VPPTHVIRFAATNAPDDIDTTPIGQVVNRKYTPAPQADPTLRTRMTTTWSRVAG
jgi:hypothetical protein